MFYLSKTLKNLPFDGEPHKRQVVCVNMDIFTELSIPLFIC